MSSHFDLLDEKVAKERLAKVLDLVSSAYPEWTKDPNSRIIREGHDTNCGYEDEILERAWRILRTGQNDGS